jgi:uncharacterized protein YneF (UPF0154 family)
MDSKMMIFVIIALAIGFVGGFFSKKFIFPKIF